MQMSNTKNLHLKYVSGVAPYLNLGEDVNTARLLVSNLAG